ncbi:methyl-accepting chemotaxis protein [Gracilibacillus boraciitolerans JCM 21714]|uniref:Methyl-accepting chemotaxis protein n=1 Tax=Gracilibacillus boraciitolerans JCM 21714 TaxID=1298598 RepID=W4VF75_9BACI|nr:methyl-accepting chemotaxis protein [Gracilibacillus boraciitolerans JCM 21714]
MKTGTEQIASTMEELASGTETQATHAGDVAAKMSDFSQKVREANENGEMIKGASHNVLGMTENGREMMTTSVAQMGESKCNRKRCSRKSSWIGWANKRSYQISSGN